MTTQAPRKQLSLFAVDTVDAVFGITPRDMTCEDCGSALMAVEDTLDLDRFACVTTGTRYECSNKDCEVYHGKKEPIF